MNVKRFTGRSTREAMQKVRLAYGENAVVLSTQPCAEGVEVLAMAPETVARIERFQDERAQQRQADQRQAEHGRRAAAQPQLAAAVPAQPAPAALPPAAAAEASGMSTMSFQDFVRQRMLKKRRAEIATQPAAPAVPVSPAALEQRLLQREALLGAAPPAMPTGALGESDFIPDTDVASFTAEKLLASPPPRRDAAQRLAARIQDERPAEPRPAERVASRARDAAGATAERRRSTSDAHAIQPHELADPAAARSSRKAAETPQPDMMRELRAMKGMIEERFGALAFMERMQKSPRQAQLAARLMECGFSPALIRKMVDSIGEDVTDEIAWAGGILQRNLLTAEQDLAIEDQGGVFAFVGSTGVGKTTSTAKLAAAFATKHGSANLGLITLDAYRLGAHEQLRAYGRILGVPVHTAHDRVALEDLLDLLSGKRLVLIDTAGLAQRDTRTRELLEMLAHPSIQRLLVVNAAAQGETIDDVLTAYRGHNTAGVVLSKLDEAVKLGPALDALIRHRMKLVAVANGQRVPEDWHRLTAQALVHRALRMAASQAWRMDSKEVNLVFAAPPPSAGSSSTRRSRSSATRSAG